MQKLLKGFLAIVAIILALALVAFMAMNLFLQSAGTQRRIERALSSALKVPVHVTSTIVTPWSGLKATGLTVPQAPPAAGNFLEAASFTARFDWFALFHRKLDASELTLEGAQVAWMQSPSGRWRLPRAEAEPGAPPPPLPQASPEAAPRPMLPARAPWQVAVHTLKVSNAVFDFWNERGMRVLEFAGVQLQCGEPSALAARGHVSARSVSLHDRLFFRDMQSDWSFEKGEAALSGFKTGIGGGRIEGDAHVATQAKHSPFTVKADFDGVNVDQLMVEAGQPAGRVTGSLRGSIELAGNSGKRSTLNGVGHLELAGGHMQYDLLQMLGEGLRIPDLVEFNLKTAIADARIVSGVVIIDKLELESQNILVTATGTVGTNGQLAIQARLTINQAVSSRLPSIIVSAFQPGEAAGTRYIEFPITGTLSHPSNPLDNLLGHHIQSQMTDLFNQLFHKKKKEPAPAPTP